MMNRSKRVNKSQISNTAKIVINTNYPFITFCKAPILPFLEHDII